MQYFTLRLAISREPPKMQIPTFRFVVYREQRGSVLVSSPAGRKTSPRDGSWDISYDQGGKMAARDVLKEVLRPGNGPCPSKGSTITVHCTGSLNTKPPKKFWRYWFCYECISIACLIYRILFIACMHVMWKYFFLFLALLPIRNNVAIRILCIVTRLINEGCIWCFFLLLSL